ncbi:hypothetical protein TWF281_006341 [Arthrobotrys megalospora]
MKISTPITSVALLSIAKLISGHNFIFEVTSSLDKDIVGAGLGYIPETQRHTYSLIDAVVFNKKNVHKGWGHGYLDTGCGVTASSHARWMQKHDYKTWMDIANKKQAWWFLEKESPLDARIGLDEYVGLQAKRGRQQDWVVGNTVNFGIPTIKPGSKLRVGFFQVNNDGAGDPAGRLKCRIDTQGNANQWTATLNVEADSPSCPGNAQSVSWNKKPEMLSPSNYALRAGVQRIYNQLICHIRNGPFGGCFAVQEAGPPPEESADPTTVVSTISSTEGSKPSPMPSVKTVTIKVGNRHIKQKVIIKYKIVIIRKAKSPAKPAPKPPAKPTGKPKSPGGNYKGAEEEEPEEPEEPEEEELGYYKRR